MKNRFIAAALAAVCLLMTACGAAESADNAGANAADNAGNAPAVTAANGESAEETPETDGGESENAAGETADGAENETQPAETTAPPAETTAQVTAPQQEVGFEGMTAVSGDSLNDGEYHITVDSSSSMFKIADCVLKVNGGEMTADVIIASKSYDYLFLGTGDEAAADGGENYISYTTDEEDRSVFSVPVSALDSEIQCAALSAKKQEWYDRTLVFRADSLPDDAFRESRYSTAETLGIADGEYTAEVTLEGGSGKSTVQSPAKLTVKNGAVTAEIIWSSNKYDYMIVDGEKYEPTDTAEFSVFEIPVKGFDYKMPVLADTTAMSKPYEIEYTLYFDSATVK